jgi:hypothetical protein
MAVPFVFHRPELNFGRLPRKAYNQGGAAAFSANKRVIADVAIFTVRGHRQCSGAPRRNGEMAVSVMGRGDGSRIGFPHDVPPGFVILASHGGRCEHGSNDQPRRQELDCGHELLLWIQRANTFRFARRQTNRGFDFIQDMAPNATFSIKNFFRTLN